MVNYVSGCDAKGCKDFYDPVTVKRLQEWDESLARFLLQLSMKKDNDHQTKKSYQEEETPDRFTARQIFLKSYTFVREEENSKETAMKKIINKLLQKNKKIKNNNNNNNNNIKAAGEKRERTCSSLARQCFYFLLSCAARVDVHA
ncbi:hypothetical protein EZV62_014131 [Acer yangbiense]|uniref:Uncharacterized protein n=1 Tax=Acer yangbiense TaxID=1000413 RepID=A0A5C7HRX1_9ROSI|nr:hypothetical protein EZV62_014131 [Acer yangbiense]